MSAPVLEESAARCLNCEAELGGPFCAACGQRAVPADPTVRELAGDAWQELAGVDGRVARSVRTLLLQPGRLTREYIGGHRVRYVSPARLYLGASLVYFVVAVAAPNLDQTGAIITAPGIRIGPSGADTQAARTFDAEALRSQAETAPVMLRPIFRAVADDPAAFRRRLFATMPRVFFALLPVFAGFTALFFRRRPFPTHLTFAAHLHAFVFIVLASTELAKFSHAVPLAAAVRGLGAVAIVVYGLKAFKAVYGESWPRTIGKVLGIQVLYALTFVPAFIVMIAWTSLT